MLQVIYFDLGGVVFTDFYSGGDKIFARKLNLSTKIVYSAFAKTDAPEWSTGSMTDQVRWKLFTKEAGLPSTRVAECIKTFPGTYRKIAGTIRLIRRLRNEHAGLKIGVLSDQPTSIARFLRHDHRDILELFDSELIIISTEVGLSKANPNLAIFREAIKRSKTKPQDILFVDNSQTNIGKAQKLGMKGFHFNVKEKSVKTLVKELRILTHKILLQ